MQGNHTRNRLGRLALVSFSTIVALVLAEVSMRVFNLGPKIHASHYRTFRISENPALGYELLPRARDSSDWINDFGLRDKDYTWETFTAGDDNFDSVHRSPDDVANVLFSSGTTGEPKAIPWTHTTPIKCIVDGHLHHDIKPGDVVAWPTNIGWMMGPVTARWVSTAPLGRPVVPLVYIW